MSFSINFLAYSLNIPYVSSEWLEAVRHVLEVCHLLSSTSHSCLTGISFKVFRSSVAEKQASLKLSQSLTTRHQPLCKLQHMANKPPVEVGGATTDALPAARPKAAGNPVFRMMGKTAYRIISSANTSLTTHRIAQLSLQASFAQLAYFPLHNRFLHHRRSLRSVP